MKNDYNLLLKIAMERIKYLKEGTSYNLNQLFEDEHWNSLPAGLRRGLGIKFSNMVSRGEIKNTIKTEEAIARNCKYIKI